MVGIEIRADLRSQAGRSFTLSAKSFIRPVHSVHVCRGASQIAQISFEVGHIDDLFYLFENGLFGTGGNEFALMCRNGAECTSAEAPSMQIDREFYHFVCRNCFSSVFGVGHTGIRKVERGIYFRFGHGRIRRIDHNCPLSHALPKSLGVVFIGFFLDVLEIFRLLPFVE